MSGSVVDLDILAKEILSLNLVQAADLVGRLEKVMGLPVGSFAIGSAAPVAQEDDSGSSGSGSKTEFDVVLAEIDIAKKVPVIRVLKDVNPDLGLMGAKDFVESLPRVLVAKVSKDKDEEIKERLLVAGAVKVIIE